jgi:tRNA (cytidine32/uridine32-2'-O)-methyltransferase
MKTMIEDTLFPNVRIVLVETSHPGNIGAAARAMKNMGLTRLVLVNPQEFPSSKAEYRAVSAADVLENASIVATVEEAIADCHLVIGTSARDRRIPWPMLDPGGCGSRTQQADSRAEQVAILFGRESRGLKNEELQQCHFHVNIPTGKAYSSLNLAMAVQVVCYEILQARLAGGAAGGDDTESHDSHEQDESNEAADRAHINSEQSWDMDFATASDLEHLFEHLERTMIELKFHDPQNPRQLMTRVRRLFNRIRPDRMEVNILRGFLTAVNQKTAAARDDQERPG